MRKVQRIRCVACGHDVQTLILWERILMSSVVNGHKRHTNYLEMKNVYLCSEKLMRQQCAIFTQTLARSESYPLRHELIESTYWLYKATRNPRYLDAGRDIVASLQHEARCTCGYCHISDVEFHNQEDHMESFFLAEMVHLHRLVLSYVSSPIQKDAPVQSPPSEPFHESSYTMNTVSIQDNQVMVYADTSVELTHYAHNDQKKDHE